MSRASGASASPPSFRSALRRAGARRSTSRNERNRCLSRWASSSSRSCAFRSSSFLLDGRRLGGADERLRAGDELVVLLRRHSGERAFEGGEREHLLLFDEAGAARFGEPHQGAPAVALIAHARKQT